MPALLDPVLDLLMLRGTVTATEPVATRMRRPRIEGDSLAGLRVRPGQQVRVLVGSGLTRRTYSVWRYGCGAPGTGSTHHDSAQFLPALAT